MALELHQTKVHDGRVEKIISFRIGELLYHIINSILLYWLYATLPITRLAQDSKKCLYSSPR